MVYQITWTPVALESYVQNIRYLEENWTKREVDKFNKSVEEKTLILSRPPRLALPEVASIQISDILFYTNEWH